jgi:hypothetical protein
MNYFENPKDVRCDKCDVHPENIIWDYTFDYDGNDRIHEYGQYTCKCGHWATFATNNPYDDEVEVPDELTS